MSTKVHIRLAFISYAFLALLSVAGVALAQVPPPGSPGSPGGTICHTSTSSTVPPAGFGVPYDVFDAGKRMLLKVLCMGSSGATLEVGVGDTNQIIYNKGYKYTSAGWQQVDLSGTPFTSGGQSYPTWLSGTATANVPSSQIQSVNNYIVAYVCTSQAGQWKCGCRDAACTSNYWQLQTFDSASTGGGTGGGGSTAQDVSYVGKFGILTAVLPAGVHLSPTYPRIKSGPVEFWWVTNGYENCKMVVGGGGGGAPVPLSGARVYTISGALDFGTIFAVELRCAEPGRTSPAEETDRASF